MHGNPPTGRKGQRTGLLQLQLQLMLYSWLFGAIKYKLLLFNSCTLSTLLIGRNVFNGNFLDQKVLLINSAYSFLGIQLSLLHDSFASVYKVCKSTKLLM